ncbi:unnamed protein product [Discosporangium mesarthrocarpum]
MVATVTISRSARQVDRNYFGGASHPSPGCLNYRTTFLGGNCSSGFRVLGPKLDFQREPIRRQGSVVLATSAAVGEERDVWRNSLLRYLGYANEVGESFRFIAPGMVMPSYVVSFGYVFGDAIDKGTKIYTRSEDSAAAAQVAIDVLLWQTLASVLIPGQVIKYVVKAAKGVVDNKIFSNLPPPVKRWVPTVVGLGIIPFIVHPIDDAVTQGMDATVRHWLKGGNTNNANSTSNGVNSDHNSYKK